MILVIPLGSFLAIWLPRFGGDPLLDHPKKQNDETIKKPAERWARVRLDSARFFLVVTSGCCALPCCGSGCWSTRPRHEADGPASLSKARWEWSEFEGNDSARELGSTALRGSAEGKKMAAELRSCQWGVTIGGGGGRSLTKANQMTYEKWNGSRDVFIALHVAIGWQCNLCT